MLAGSLHLQHKRFVDHFPETTIVQDGIAEAEDALRRVAQMLRTHGAGLVPHKERSHSPTVSSASERTFLNHRLGDRRPYALWGAANNSSPMPDLIPRLNKAAHRFSRTTPQLRNAVLPICVAHSSSPHQSLNAMTPISKRTMKRNVPRGNPTLRQQLRTRGTSHTASRGAISNAVRRM